MESLDAQQTGRRSCAGDRSFPLPVDGGRIVGEIENGGFSDIHFAGKHIVLCYARCQFKVAVGDGASRVSIRDEAILN
jgi:hypothetical protein